jgi:hypothetical protein
VLAARELRRAGASVVASRAPLRHMTAADLEEARVAEQVEELGGVGRLKRFLAPQLAELIVSQGDSGTI